MPAKRKAPTASSSNQETPKARPSKLAKENDINASQENEIKEAYTLFAIPHKSHAKEGVLPTKDVRRALIALDIAPQDPGQLKEFLEILDPDDEGYTTYANFVAICALQMHNRVDDRNRGDEEEEMRRRHAFGLFLGKDKEASLGRGEGEPIVTINDLRRVARELKEEVDDDVLKDMILEANGGAGMAAGVRMEEFEGVMKRAGVWR